MSLLKMSPYGREGVVEANLANVTKFTGFFWEPSLNNLEGKTKSLELPKKVQLKTKR